MPTSTGAHLCSQVSEWNHNYHVPQCADLPGRKPGSIWRCRTPALSTGRPYLEEANAKHAPGRGPRPGGKTLVSGYSKSVPYN